jgi:hypothetical protein
VVRGPAEELVRLPQPIRDRLVESLLKYADRNEGVAMSLYSYGLIMKFENIPEQRRERILNNIIKHIDSNEKFAESIATMVRGRGNVIPARFESTINYELPQSFIENLAESLLKYADDNKTIATWLIYLCYEVPSKLSTMLIKLNSSKFEEIRLSVAFFIIANYVEIDSDTLDTLIKNNDIRRVMIRNKGFLDEFLRNELESAIA